VKPNPNVIKGVTLTPEQMAHYNSLANKPHLQNMYFEQLKRQSA
jgi:hypothetical protein